MVDRIPHHLRRGQKLHIKLPFAHNVGAGANEGHFYLAALHQIIYFSIVKDDGNGRYANELEFENTVDPSPYLGMVLNYSCTSETTGCTSEPLCTSS
jgi:hypothetical protein